MAKIILIVSCLFCMAAKHPIYNRILELRPDIDKKFAMDLSNMLYRYSKQFGTDPYISVAIGMQETGLRQINREAKVLLPSGRVVHGVTDISLWQFHINTAVNYGMDLKRLQTDLDYATYWHVKLLAGKIKLCKTLGSVAWTCYHSKTPKFREKYETLVKRYLK